MGMLSQDVVCQHRTSFLIDKEILILIIHASWPYNIVFHSLKLLFSILTSHIHSVNLYIFIIRFHPSYFLPIITQPLWASSISNFEGFYRYQKSYFLIFFFILINLQILPKCASTTVKRWCHICLHNDCNSKT